MDYSKYIPKHKNDLEAIALLYELDDSIIDEISGDLLEWMADLNWPIAKAVKDLVLAKQDVFIKGLGKVLEGDDQEAKYAIITNIIEDLSEVNFKVIEKNLYRIYINPTESEIAAEVFLELKERVEDERCITFKK